MSYCLMSKKIDNPKQPKKPAAPKTSKRDVASTTKKPATRKKSATPKVSGNGKVSQKKSTKNATKTEKTTTQTASKNVEADVQTNKKVETNGQVNEKVGADVQAVEKVDDNVSLDDLIASNFGDLMELDSDGEERTKNEDFGDDVLRSEGKSADLTKEESATEAPVKGEDKDETEEDYEPREVENPEVGDPKKDIKNIPGDNPKEEKQDVKQEVKDNNSPTNNGGSENAVEPGNDIDAIAAQKEAALKEAAQKWSAAYSRWNTVFTSVKNAAKATARFPDSEVRQANLASKQAELQEVKNELADAIKELKKANEVEPGDSFDVIVAKKEAALKEATQKWEAANKRCNSVSLAARSAANAAARFPNDEAKKTKSASKQADLKAAKETLDTAIKELKKAKKEADEAKQQAAEIAAQQADEAAAQKPAEVAVQQADGDAVQQASEGSATGTGNAEEAAEQSVQNDEMNKLIENSFGEFFASDGNEGPNSGVTPEEAAAAAAAEGAGSNDGNPLTGGHTGSFERPANGGPNPPDTGASGTQDGNGQDGNGNDSNGTVKPIPLVEILRKAAQDESANYMNVAQFITMLEPSVVKSLSSKYYEDDCLEDCKSFVTFLSELLNLNSYREVSIILSEVVAYIKKNAGVTLSAMNIIMYCNELNKNITDRTVLDISGIGYTKIRIMVENAFIINYLNTAGVSLNLAVGNNVDTHLNNMVLLAVSTAYSIYGYMLGDISDKYAVAFQRIETEKPEMLSVVTEGDYGAFYKMLKTFSGYSTVGIDLNDIDLNIDSYSPGEAASLYAAVIAKMDELAARYHKIYEKEDVERVVDSVASRGYRASQTNVIEYYCDEVLNPKKPKGEGNAKDSISVDHGMDFATRAFIPSGYGLSKSHIEISKPYTEVFGIPFINIRHPLFRTIAMKYSNRYSKADKQSKGKTTATERAWAKRLHEVMVNADKAERQLVKEIKQGSLMSKFLVGDKTKDTQVEGEGLGFMSTIEKGLRKVTSFATNPKLIKNILKLIKLAIDGIETPVSRTKPTSPCDSEIFQSGCSLISCQRGSIPSPHCCTRYLAAPNDIAAPPTSGPTRNFCISSPTVWPARNIYNPALEFGFPAERGDFVPCLFRETQGIEHVCPDVVIGHPELLLVALPGKSVGRYLVDQVVREAHQPTQLAHVLLEHAGYRREVASQVPVQGAVSDRRLGEVPGAAYEAVALGHCLPDGIQGRHAEVRGEVDASLPPLVETRYLRADAGIRCSDIHGDCSGDTGCGSGAVGVVEVGLLAVGHEHPDYVLVAERANHEGCAHGRVLPAGNPYYSHVHPGFLEEPPNPLDYFLDGTLVLHFGPTQYINHSIYPL